MSDGKQVAVLLSGCGVFDGAEIHEAVITLLTLSRAGVRYQCTAPDKNQLHVIDHRTGNVAEGETRNVLTEAARIARGEIVPLSEIKAADYDALFLPGGFGAAKQFSTFAIDGPDGTVDPDVQRVLRDFHEAGKPIGAVCIAPAVVVQALGKGEVTIGEDAGAAGGIEKLGGKHHTCPVTEMTVDRENKLVTAPAYMYGDAAIKDVAAGIEKAIHAVLELA